MECKYNALLNQLVDALLSRVRAEEGEVPVDIVIGLRYDDPKGDDRMEFEAFGSRIRQLGILSLLRFSLEKSVDDGDGYRLVKDEEGK